MPITAIDNDRIEQVCAACGASRAVAICEVDVRAPEQGQDGIALALPECPRCRSVEVLLPDGQRGAERQQRGRVHPHQLLVDLIAVRCGHSAMTEELEAELAAVFPHGLRLEAPAVAAAPE